MILTRPLRKPLWIISFFLKKHRRLITLVTLVVIAILLASRNLVAYLPKIIPQQKIGFVGQYTLNNLPAQISQSISRSLISLTVNGEIQGDLAEKWETLEAETVYRLSLKPNLFWSDGAVVNSQDIKFDIPNVTISYPSNQTIEFGLKESFSPFLSVLFRPVIKKNQATVGNYTIKKITFQGQYLKTIELSGTQQNLVYKFYPSNESAWLGFKLGEIDQLENLITNPINSDWETKVILEKKVNHQQYLAIIFNLNDSQLSNKSLRQALAYAIKAKSDLPENRALGPISPLSWAYNPNLKRYDYNPAQAQELFKKAETEASLSAQLEITLGTSQTFVDLADSIAKDWEETLNLKVNVKIINSIESNFQAILVAQEIPLDPDQHSLWHSTQITNLTHYSDLKIDKLLEDGRKISDQKKRQEIYQDFQRFLVEDSPAIFLQYPTIYTIKRH